MLSASIPVDLLNPGQVFACIGFVEAADVVVGSAVGGVDWSDRTNARFMLRARGEEDPIGAVLDFLAGAEVVSLAPFASTNATSKFGVPTETLPLHEPFPYSDPPSIATLPAALKGRRADGTVCRLVIDHWGDETRRDATKFWGGGAGYSGAARARDAVDLVRSRCKEARADPFNLAAPQTSSFRLDWRRDYIPIDAGFSLNSHDRMVSVGFPLVELLGALGLGNARPRKLGVLEYRYGVLGSGDPTAVDNAHFDPMLLRAALGDAPLPFERRSFRMRLGWPAKPGQERSINTVTEEKVR